MRKKALTLSVFTAATMASSPAFAQADLPAVDAPETVTDIGTGDAVVQLLTPVTGAVLPGQDAWVTFMWRGDAVQQVREFKVTAVGSEGVEISYPADHLENDRDHSSLMESSVLDSGYWDFTALKLVVNPKAVDPKVSLTVSYESDSGPVVETFVSEVKFDTTPYEGKALDLGSDSLGSIVQGEAAWLPFDVNALHNASEIEIRVGDAGGFDVRYPNEVDFSSLSQGSRIVVGTDDYAAIRFDSLDLKPGVYPVVLEASYFVGLTPVTQKIERTIEIVVSGSETGSETPDGTDTAAAGGSDAGTDGGTTEVAGPVTVGSLAQGIDGWQVNPYGTDTATTGVWGYGQPPVGIWNKLLLEMGSTPSGNKGWFTLSGTGTEMGDHDLDDGESSVLSPVYSLPNVASVHLDFDYYLSYLNNATADDSLSVVMITKGGNKVILNERAKSNKNKEAAWKSLSVELSKYAGQDVQFLVTAGDRGTASYVEAAIDGFTITAQ